MLNMILFIYEVKNLCYYLITDRERDSLSTIVVENEDYKTMRLECEKQFMLTKNHFNLTLSECAAERI
jgi:hypothetical protein